MKTFSSTASRIRSYSSALRAIGLTGICLAVGWLGFVALRPAPKIGQSPLLPSPGMPVVNTTQRSQWLSVMESRPLRQPTSQVVVSTSPAKKRQPPNIEVVGTMVNPGQTPRAFVRSKTGNSAGKLLTVQPGKEVDGAIVKEIIDGQVTLEFAGEEFVVKMGRKPS